MRRACAAAVLGVASVASATQQVGIRAPGMQSPTGYRHHGTPMPAELSEIAIGGYLRRAVQTRGTLMPLEPGGQYFELSEGGRVVVMPVGEMGDALDSLRGRRVEVVGLVRALVEEQEACPLRGRWVPQSYCDDPDLPPTPDLGPGTERAGWPRTSITVWSVFDITSLGGAGPAAGRTGLAELLADETPPDKPVRVIGQFCGANLCGGLGARPHPSAWVLQDDDVSVWVVGKEPKGKGWRLDPTYPGDTSRWVEVKGRIRPCGSARCLHAQSIALVPRPGRGDP